MRRVGALFLAVLLLAGCVKTPSSTETPAAELPIVAAPQPAPPQPAPPIQDELHEWVLTGYSFAGLPGLSAWAADEGQIDLLDAREGRALVGVSVQFSDERGGLEQGYNTYTSRLAVLDLETGAVAEELTPAPDLLCTAGLLTDDGVLVLAEGGDGYRLYRHRNGAATLLDQGARGFSWNGTPAIVPLGDGFAAFPVCDLENETLGVKLVTPSGAVLPVFALSGTEGALLCGNGAQYAFVTVQDGNPAVLVGDRSGGLGSFALHHPSVRVRGACLLDGAVLLSLDTGEAWDADRQSCELALFDFDGNELMPPVMTALPDRARTPSPMRGMIGNGGNAVLGLIDGRPYFVERLRDELWVATLDLELSGDVFFSALGGQRFLVRTRGRGAGQEQFFLLDLDGGVRNQGGGVAAYDRLLDAFGGELPNTENYAGAFLDDRGRLVVRLTDEEGVTREAMRELLRGYPAVVERAEYSLKTLKEMGAAYLKEMEIPRYGHGVDEEENAYVIEVDAKYGEEIAAAEARRAETGFPVILRPGEPLQTFPQIEEGALGAEDGAVTLRLKEGSVTPTRAIFILENHSDHGYTYGSPYHLHRKTAAGEWEGVEITTKGFWGFTLVAYLLPPGESREMVTDWEWLCGELPPGSYRFVTGVIPEDGGGEDQVMLAAEFEVG